MIPSLVEAFASSSSLSYGRLITWLEFLPVAPGPVTGVISPKLLTNAVSLLFIGVEFWLPGTPTPLCDRSETTGKLTFVAYWLLFSSSFGSPFGDTLKLVL